MGKLYIPVLAGTVREGRQSILAARAVVEVGKTIEGVETELVDPKDLNFPGDGKGPDERDPRYTEITARADGFFIITPEYNHSFPGTLKRMLDSEMDNYIHKPAAMAGVSVGPWGGVRAIESLVNVLRELGLVATFTDMHFPNVHTLFDENGALKDKQYEQFIREAWTELIWMAQVLKEGREHVPSKFHQ